MAKLSPNSPCPCQSGQKYKKCCLVYHKGAVPKNALLLMKSRYSAYAAGESRYIIRTTHPDNLEYCIDTKEWIASIDHFCSQTDFLGLEIIDFQDGEEEAFVTFRAKLSSGVLEERSRFLKESGRWLYVDGDFDLHP